LPRDTAKGKPKRKSAANTLTESFGAGGNQFGESKPILIDRAAFNQGENAQYQPHISDDPIVPSLVAQGPHAVFTKSRRAQSATDDETWVPGEVNPTLNSFDVGDTRATTAIIEPILVDGRRMNDVRVYNPPVQTLGARMGTGGNNVPVIGFSHTQGLSAQPSEDAFPTLRTEGNGMAVAIPIDTRNALRDPEKYDAQNRQGLGIGNDGDPMATLTSTHVNAVAYGIQGNVIGRQPENGPAGKGHTEEGDPMFTLTGTDVHAVAYDEYNDSINETHHALRAGTKQSTGVLEPTMAVRRLTPLECERLMGWPDDHTRFKADGTEQADTHRYKQCGNGVASPVAEWIGKQLMKLDEAPQ